MVVDKYSSQDNVQVLAIVTALLKLLNVDFPELANIMIGSDNASCLASHDIIAYIHYLNKEIQGIKVSKWIYTEACTGKNRLDTHFSYVNLRLKAYVLDGGDVITESDICEAISHLGGIAGTTAVLFDGSELTGPVLKNKKRVQSNSHRS